MTIRATHELHRRRFSRNLGLGLVLGLANGAVDCWLLALALWFLVGVTGGKLSWLNGYILSQSVGYGIFGSINPFV